MSRTQQTVCIVGAIFVALFIGIGVSKAGPDPDYPRCELGFMGSEDTVCRGREAARHLMRM